MGMIIESRINYFIGKKKRSQLTENFKIISEIFNYGNHFVIFLLEQDICF